jgi:Ca2+-binding RTX toxin-like protein
MHWALVRKEEVVSVKFRRIVTGVGAALLLVAAQVALLATPAQAATSNVKISGAMLVFKAGDNIGSEILIDIVGGYFKVSDSAGPVTPGWGCAVDQSDPNKARAVCPVNDPQFGQVKFVSADAGNFHDTLGVRGTLGFGNMIAFLNGGEGNDELWIDIVGSGRLYGGTGHDTLEGGSGPDLLFGEAGNDWLWGYGGDDTLVGGPGGDVMSGGPGVDTVSYTDHLKPVVADADGTRGDDGEAGEGDTIQPDVETLRGGGGNDLLIGSAANDELSGGVGDDTLVGGGGSDALFGEAGRDWLYGDGPEPSGLPTDTDLCVVGPDGGTTFDCEVVA